MSSRYYITTPIYYVNGSPHIGHAYTSLAADILARFNRLDGREVFFVTGTDEHGQKVEQAAQASGLDTQSFVDKVSAQFRAMADAMNISYDDFVRTTEPRHKVTAQALWKKVVDAGYIYLGAYEGYYSLRDEAFYAREELSEQADGTLRAPTGAPVAWVREPSYFFRLSAFEERLLALYDTHSDFLLPAGRRNEIVSFVRQGLRDLSISRTSFKWGISVPDDPAHVMYVWFDALANYLTALGFPNQPAEKKGFWPASVHMVGKDIIRFHAVFWPAFLMAADLPLPKSIFANGWWTIEGEKMSKSIGNVIDPRDLIATYGLDPIRFFLIREIPFGGDSDLNRRSIVNRLNVELANDLGNLAQRTLSFIARHCDGKLPIAAALTDVDRTLLESAAALAPKIRESFARFALTEGLEEIWKVIRACNAYIDHQAPWSLRKSDTERMGTVLRVLHEALRHIATLLQPYMPDSMAKLLTQLGVEANQRDVKSLGQRLTDGHVLPAPEGVFPRFVEASTPACQG